MSDLATSALVLVGHGSASNPGASRSTRAHAKSLADRRVFGSVHVAFLKEAPLLDGVLDTVAEDTVFIVPHMASKGYLTDTLIPAALGLSGAVTERTTPHGRQRLYLCDPTGTHPALMDAAAQTVRDVIEGGDGPPAETCVLVAGHGNPRNAVNADQTRQLATHLRDHTSAGFVHCAFLEEKPFIKDWQADTSAATVIVMPFLISGGLHGARDVPALMGLDPDDERLSVLDKGNRVAGPFTVGERTIFYIRPIGADPVVEEIAIRRARDALTD